MKSVGILNSALSEAVASMGHFQYIVLGDAGLPVPSGVRRIDLALDYQNPRLADVLRVVLRELYLEEALVAQETQDVSPQLYAQIRAVLRRDAREDLPVHHISHEKLKEMCGGAVAVVRTGECTPYGNIVLVSGVDFDLLRHESGRGAY
ncbi:MAG: D-ribose pyranase [Christensenellales bacterium]|jgi:D-ribose pyranase